MMEVEAKTRNRTCLRHRYYSGIDMSDFEKALKRELRTFTRKEKIKKIFR